MSDRMFKEIYEQVRVMLWFIFICLVAGVLFENELAVLVSLFMILTISCVLVIVKYVKEPSKPNGEHRLYKYYTEKEKKERKHLFMEYSR